MNLPSAVSVSITTVPTFPSSQTAENSVMHSSRVEAACFEELGLKLGARIIAADRPGFGWSSPHPSHTLLDHPRDLERLAEHLGLDEYGVLGISGGGPYALACAFSLPHEKLKCVSIVCGLGGRDIGMRGAGWPTLLGFTWRYRLVPTPTRWWFQRQLAARLDLSDEKHLELLQQDVSSRSGSKATLSREVEKELEVMRDEHVLRLFLRTSRESFAHGCDPTVQDGRLISTDFGFQVEDIRSDLPVQLWYGKHDSCVPLNHGVQIAARLGGRAHLRVEDESHWSISNNRREEYLEALLSCM
ncbi:alpha/beta hydrolase fold family protein [Coccidioides posadasii C735 delta SOWgp]|uniref:Alpha/beta hydrolase fold family protein n=1 Tax=Coccidioides posadasii (strain C735) TaxID=222929 RepID=C5P210_COCP7|nr:alpha/beta hydrolase fold family protein [Coccidioides posadasii C735 delta SOWgp]EER28913.1 alpha/beta hydrolase fold family protein [Coccidioides posadasii C735 delta SOWgp]|eukprot:XP_003071058.1 alpha/beta hydrolase fold family protein [Coccidioides posadasii C735 delta SOWgp]